MLESAISWRHMAPCDHLVQFYKNDDALLRLLTEFVLEGLSSDESVIIIATPGHRQALQQSLAQRGVDLPSLQKSDSFIPLDADQTLSSFMTDATLDPGRFQNVIGDLVRRAGKNGRQFRAFGEMVALLVDKGHHSATIQLENLWEEQCHIHSFPLLCAYPELDSHQPDFCRQICNAHSTIISTPA